MILILCTIVALGATSVFCYHDPDLNYHLNQLQSFDNSVQKGYNYPAPSVQLTASGVKIAGAPAYNQALNTQSYTYAKAGYSNIGYQNSFLPQQTYLPPVGNFNQPQTAVYSTQKEAHGYATSAGLSSFTGGQRTVTPLATYAQAPIIAKITAAPLIARYANAPAKNSFVNQNFINGYNSGNTNTVVSQVIAAPSATYAASPPLRVQNAVVNAQSGKYVEAVAQNAIPTTQFSTQATSSSFVSSAGGHFAASVTPVVNVQTVPSVQTHQFFLPNQYSSPVHSVPVTHYSTPVSQISSAVVSHVPAPAIGHAASPVVAKNIHTEFLENYDAHPRYNFEYRVHDPHTGDIKHQQEERDGEVVKGQYSLVEADGSVRTVEYVADWETGFHANVRNSKQNH